MWKERGDGEREKGRWEDVQRNMEEHQRVGFRQLRRLWRHLLPPFLLSTPDVTKVFRPIRSEGPLNRVDAR